MGEVEEPLNEEATEPGSWERLLETPVGRRWLLKAGLGSALLAGARFYAGPAAASAAKPAHAEEKAGPVRTTLQFALGPAHGVTDLVLVGGARRIALTAHTASSRAALRPTGRLWDEMDLGALTHYVSDLELPDDRARLLSVHGRRGGRDVLVAQTWHAPASATLRLARVAERLTGTVRHAVPDSPRLKALGLSLGQIRTAEEVAALDRIVDSHQTATALVMFHPNVSTIDPDAAATTKSVLGDTAPVQSLGTQIGQMQKGGKDYATLDTVTDEDGSPTELKLGDLRTGFQTVRLNESETRFQESLRSGVSGGILAVRDTDSLGAVIDTPLDEAPKAAGATWVQPEGLTPRPTPYGQVSAAGSKVDVQIKNEGTLFGTRTVKNGELSGNKVSIKLYNNFVRWIWVYVQYLGPGDKNMSLDPDAKFPHTKYAKSVCIVPQVFTVLGVPLWDTNTVKFELEFPEGAHTARLLYCGLGSTIKGDDWRQYFPSGAYPDKIAPTDEVLYPALTTGIVTIGLNVFALATDLGVAITWKGVSQYFEDFDFSTQALREAISPFANLAKADVAASTVIGGAATYLSVKNRGEDISNMWNIVLGAASVLPKLMFNGASLPIWNHIGEQLLEEEAADRLLDAMPFIGQAYGILSAVGDLATLAECGAETVVSPWVIENEVSLSYRAQLTISRDPRGSTFPATARSWQLDATLDGAPAAVSVSGEINQGGRTRSDPLVLEVAAPFGGKELQWSFVLRDAAGKQVGTGVSDKLANDDPKNPPATVAFAITQLPATIDGTTVFKRSDTVTYSPRAGGYTWSDSVAVTATSPSGGLQEISGSAVATLAGVAGMVFKQNDKYYLRGVPLGQNAETISLGTPTKTGYSRRPFLLLDSFVDAADKGNHVLLEPDDTTPGYNIRAVTLDGQTGKLTWDPSVSHGYFQTAISAAALHSSGQVVAINTDNGRLAWLKPVQTPRPALAAYTAGPGTQVGLLSSPIALAVTNDGAVLVLEAGTAQVSAYDLNGNPIKYFGADKSDYSLSLGSDGTYLDIAVDGAANIYLLYFTGGGDKPENYRVDVYAQDGTPIDTHSPGVNVPHLSVDYWRSIFAANYAPIINQQTGDPHLDPALGVPEPSLSRFDPS